MGSLLLILALQLLLLLCQAKKGLRSHYDLPQSVPTVRANFRYERIDDPVSFAQEARNLSPPWTLPPDALRLSITLREEKPCVKVAFSVNASGLPELRGFHVDLLEISWNGHHSFNILRKKKDRKSNPAGGLWTVEYDCWRVEPDQDVLVSLMPIPNYGVTIRKQVAVHGDKIVIAFPPSFVNGPMSLLKKERRGRRKNERKRGRRKNERKKREKKERKERTTETPEFEFQHLEEEKRIVVSLPQPHEAYTRLCHLIGGDDARKGLCHELENSDKQLIRPTQNVSLPYEDLLHCLCIEVFYPYQNSKRKKKCPFEDHQERYAADLLRVSAKLIKYHVNTMLVLYKKTCGETPEVTLCRKEHGDCVTIPDVMIEKRSKGYSIVGIDMDPHLCFKFSIMNSTHIKCPHGEDQVWSVTMDHNKLFHVLLHISSSVSEATFSAAICDPDQSYGSCASRGPVYNFSEGQKVKTLSLPWPGLASCIQVWRTDVRFAHKRVLCSFDYSHRHLGLIFLVALLVFFTAILLLFLGCRRICKIFTAPLWRRTILLVYSPDSAEYKTLICAFADFLQSILGCEVILDMWDMNTISQIGMIAWFYQKRELVSQRKGKVMFVWTERTKSMYHQWMSCQVSGTHWKDPANLFGAAMSCLNKDLAAEQNYIKLKEYSIVYFEGLCERKDIPKSLKKISKFRLFEDLDRLVRRLQDTPCLSPPCLIKGAAKYLIRKLKRSEKRKGLQEHVELCKKKLSEEVNLEKNKMPHGVL